MEDTIRVMLLDHFRNMINGKHLEQLNVDVSKVITFHPFEMNIENLNNISGINVGFTCWIDGKKKDVDKSKKTYSFSFNGVIAVMRNNEVVGLDFNDLNIPFYTAEG
tara:strand:- start:1556 stop:1876 length:321 start_codon:yes stop_codon:yes gene_type:complete